MNNIVSIVEYYVEHNNADDSVVNYIKSKIDDCNLTDLIIIQVELLFTDPSDKLVSGLVSYITNKINELLTNIKLVDLANTISLLEIRKKELNIKNEEIVNENNIIFNDIRLKQFDKYIELNEDINKCVGRLISLTQDNVFFINKNKNEIKSIDIWLNNLINSYTKRVNRCDIRDLLNSYTELLNIFDNDEFINNYVNIVSFRLDDLIFHSNLIDSITNVMPELDKLYKEMYNTQNNIFKILDYYIDLLDINIKKEINNLDYEEKLLIKEKITIISNEILSNSTDEDDFKALVINSYIKYF